jgi:hypothetical protein
MQLIDPTAVTVLLVVVGVTALVVVGLLAASLVVGVRGARRDRLARHESIPAYYGRLHFAH